MKVKYILVAAGIAALIGLSVGLYMYNKPHTDYQEADADFTGSGTDFYRVAKADEAAFLDLYLNKAAIIEAEVGSIEGAATLLLKPGIICTLTQGGSTSTQAVGDIIKVKGRVVGAEADLLSGDLLIAMDQCEVK